MAALLSVWRCFCVGLQTPVAVFQPDDVVFTKIGAGLDFDRFERDLARVFQRMNDADGDVRRLVFSQQKFLIGIRDASRACDNDPVFGAVVVRPA